MVAVKNSILLFLNLILLSSCLDKYSNFNVTTDTEMIVPLAHGSITIGDVLKNFNNDSIFQYGHENELIFAFKEDEVSKFYLKDLIAFPQSVKLANESKKLDNIILGDSSYNQSIALSELIKRLTSDEEIPLFDEGEKIIFPEIFIGRENASFLTWTIDGFDFIQEATFIDGSVVCSLTNNFQTKCEVEIELFDTEGTVIDKFSFTGKSKNGLLPSESEILSKDLAGKSLKTPLSFKITSLHFFESSSYVVIDLKKGIDFTVQLKNMRLEKGIFNSIFFKYKSPVEQITLELVDSVKLHKVKIETANLNVRIKKQFQPSGILTVYFPKLLKAGNPFSITMPLDDNSFTTCDFNLDGTEILLESSMADFNSFEYYFEFKSSENQFIELENSDSFEYTIDLKNLELSYVEGDFGNKKIEFNMNNFSLDPELWNKYNGEIFGNNPVLTLYVSNPFGIPILSDFNLKATNRTGESVTVFYPSYLMPFPQNIENSPVLSEIEFNQQNSNIADFIKLPPNDSIKFSANLELNPYGSPVRGSLNFVNMNDPFVIGIGFKVPVLVKGSFFNFCDTLKITTGHTLDFVKRAVLIFRTKNRIPLQVNLSVTPFDTVSGSVIGNELFVTLLEAAQTDELGNVTALAEAENEMIVEGDNLIHLKNSNSLLIKASFISPENGTKPAKLKYDDGFDLKLILDVTTDL
jgi:hypothetical protein